MVHVEVSLRLALLGLGLAEVGVLAQVRAVQLLLERLVAALRHNALLLQDGEDAHGLLDQVDARLQIHAEVHHLPRDALLPVLLLLQHEHVVVEELLQLLVRVVDAQLLEAVVVEDLEAGDVEHADEVLALGLGVQRLVHAIHQPPEATAVNGLAQGADRVHHLIQRYEIAIRNRKKTIIITINITITKI